MIAHDDTSTTQLASDRSNLSPDLVGRLEGTELPYHIMASVIVVLDVRFPATFGEFSDTHRAAVAGSTTRPTSCTAGSFISKRMRGTPHWMGHCQAKIA